MDECVENEQVEQKSVHKKRRRRAFTLIELLAVIIILGVLMIIAIPAVTNYISNSRKEAYVKTAKQVISGARNIVNGGKLDMFDTDTIYYIPNKCIRVENGDVARSPYGEFISAYVGVTYSGNDYDYYWVSEDEQHIGILLKQSEELSIDDVQSGIYDVEPNSTVPNKSKILVLDENTCSNLVKYAPKNKDSFENTIISDLENGYTKKYDGEHQDTMGGSGNKDIYYYYAQNDSSAEIVNNKNNVLFANICWKIIRTTDTGGIKLMYNGEADADGKCNTNRGNHVGYYASHAGTRINLTGSFYYGTDYIYDKESNTFKVSGSIEKVTWSNQNKNKVFGKYTCLSETEDATCETIYYVDPKNTAFDTYTYVFTLKKSTPYSAIATIPFNYEYQYYSGVGYMYNKVYPTNVKYDTYLNNTNYIYGSDVKYENGKYKLLNTMTIKDMTTAEDRDKVNSHRYTCFSSTTDECQKVSYIYAVKSGYLTSPYYMELVDGRKYEDAISEMLWAPDVNSKDSVIKEIIDEWYRNNLEKYTDYLEDIIYCNHRGITNLNKESYENSLLGRLYFELDLSTYLNCVKDTDKFSTLNPKAKLKYPVGIPTVAEMRLMNHSILKNSGYEYWIASPYYHDYQLRYLNVNSSGGFTNTSMLGANTVRPVVSLKPGTGYIKGDGSMDNPYVVYTSIE